VSRFLFCFVERKSAAQPWCFRESIFAPRHFVIYARNSFFEVTDEIFVVIRAAKRFVERSSGFKFVEKMIIAANGTL